MSGLTGAMDNPVVYREDCALNPYTELNDQRTKTGRHRLMKNYEYARR